MDIKTVHRRVEHEGMSFLTISLPNFGKDIEKCLDQGYADRNLFQGFSWQAGLPRFLGGFLDLVFDRGSGVLLNNPSHDAIFALRQLSLMFGKILLPCSDARVKAAYDGFIECEKDVRVSDSRLNDLDWFKFREVSDLLFGKIFSALDTRVFDRSLLPKHGPGATADFLSGNAKWSQSTWTTRLQEFFPWEEYLVPNDRFSSDLGEIDILEPGRELPARVVDVPKTLKTPRIIAIEPTAMQYCQQALSDALICAIKEDDYLRHMIGFTDQTVNNRMAREGSLSGDLATLDLSEASDRVSNQHVREMLSSHPQLHGAVDACRSRKADVLGKTVRLAKFASMGSALCFPVEAMVFLTLLFIGLERELRTPLTRKLIKEHVGRVRVYGDDIIIPQYLVRSAIETLEHYGIKVNSRKSFWTGKFRESCGKEFYDGTDVSIVRVRREFPTLQRRDPEEISSVVSLRNQLYWAGLWGTVRWLDSYIEKILFYFPVVESTSSVLGRESVLPYQAESIHPTLHTPLVKGWVRRDPTPKDNLSESGALLKCLLMLERKSNSYLSSVDEAFEQTPLNGDIGQPADVAGHLERAGRPQSANIKLRKATPY
jgi:hypothetical protein